MSKAAYITAIGNVRTEITAMEAAEAALEAEVIAEDGSNMMFTIKKEAGTTGGPDVGGKELLDDLDRITASMEAWSVRWS